LTAPAVRCSTGVMAYTKCVACGSTRLSPVTRVSETSHYSLRAELRLKVPAKGFLANQSATLDIDRVCVCAECGYAAFFASKAFDPDGVAED
jgi:hypothetical protein